MPMTSEAKGKLARTIRALRERLQTELHEATDREYRLSVRTRDTKLNVARSAKRKRLEDWLAEQIRAETGKKKRDKDDFRRDAEKQAAYTLLNRLVILRFMEATGLRKPVVVTGGWNSRGYKDFRELAPALVRSDDSEGYTYLLQLIFEDLAKDLPGLYGSAGIADLIPVPSATIRAVVEAFDDPELATCWTDDMTLGWIYQYWNDPEREALDAKTNDGGKIEPHEIASKTQMFTERYMVDWLLQNSLGPLWLAMCQKHGWTPEVESDGTLERLEQRRVEWRAKRDAGEVAQTELMPLETDAERRCAYYVPQPIPDDAINHAPESVRDLKILDPAVGSGHFLVVAFDLLVPLYKEEARHRGETDDERWSDVAIVECILEHNLHGVDLDPRAVQIAAAALWLKAQQVCAEAQPRQLNLVASNLGIASLPDNDPALVELRQAVEDETGIPANLTNQIIDALRGADHLGSLLKIDEAIEEAITEHERSLNWDENVQQLNLFPDGHIEQKKFSFPKERMQFNVLSALEAFLSQHTSAQELGLRLHGEQLAAGVRFVRLVREDTYDLVVGNPPYQGTSKLQNSTEYKSIYPEGTTDLFAGMTIRSLELLRASGTCAFIALSNWMFIKSFLEFRAHVLSHHLYVLADLGKAAFSTGGTLISTACYVIRNASEDNATAVALRPNSPEEVQRDSKQPRRAAAALLLHRGRYNFTPVALKVVPEWPVIYWWPKEFLERYDAAPKLAETCPARSTQGLYNNTRFTRRPHEVAHRTIRTIPDARATSRRWAPFVDGSAGAIWFEPLRQVANWGVFGLEPKCYATALTKTDVFRYANEQFFFRQGSLAFATIGSAFNARAIVHVGIFGNKGRSLFPDSVEKTLCALNSRVSQEIMASLNPTIDFTVGGVNRLALFPIASSSQIVETIRSAFHTHESHREPAFEFVGPGPSSWLYTQGWGQRAIDRPDGEPLPSFDPVCDAEPAANHISFAVGVALGRFGSDEEGILDPIQDDLSRSLNHGILFLDGTLTDDDDRDSLGHRAAGIIRETWSEFGARIDQRRAIREWLRERFFRDVHRQMYENRPIHWPLSSASRTFVAWVSIHRWNDQTLRVLLADHLQPTLTRLDGEIDDLNAARGTAEKNAARDVEQRYDDVKGWREELVEFIQVVEQCADKGPAPSDPKKLEREVDARYIPDLDDGVMINSAALWPLLEPQWKDPKKWWKELVAAKGKRDYDWSHLAMRYWPTRVDEKCQTDPSLGVAHGCFWKYHPARAWAWELRLQDEIGPDFRIEEASYLGDGGDEEHRDAYIAANPEEALETVAKEVKRRAKKQGPSFTEMHLLEPNLWSQVPAQCWELELVTSGKQEVDFRLHAPDSDESRDELLHEQPQRALGIVEVEICRRGRMSELRLIDSGLWITIPADCWKLERRIARLNDAPFRLVDPDEESAREVFVRDHPADALQILKEDIEARRPTHKRPLLEITIPDAGLWSALPDECWELEMSVIKTQKDDFRIVSPDETTARTAYENENPEKVRERKASVARLSFGDDDSDTRPNQRKKTAKKRAAKKKSSASEAKG